MFKQLLVLLAISSSMFCSEEVSTQHYDKPFLSALKVAKRKGKSSHKMAGIDFIYVVTAKICHRFNDLKRSFAKYGLNPYRFTAFESKDISFNSMLRTCLHGSRRYSGIEANRLIVRGGEFVLDKGKMSSSKEGYVHRGMSLKSLSRSLSHISIIKDALDSGYETIWIMDSATELRRNPNDLSIYVAKANEAIPGWTSLYTDYSERDQADQLKPLRKFFFRPDVEFLDPDDYLARADNIADNIEEAEDAYTQDDSDTDKSSSRNLVGYKKPVQIAACEKWDQNHTEHQGSLDGATGPSDQPGSNSSNEGNRARAYFVNQNQCVAVDNSSNPAGVEGFSRVGLLKGAHSYILNRKGMKIILDYYLEHKIYIPYAQEIQIIEGMQPYYIPEPITMNMNKG